MSTWLIVLLQVMFFAIVMFVIYKYAKERILYKYNPNKWVILSLSGLIFLIPILSSEYFKYSMSGTVWQYLDSMFFIIFFLWFVDVSNGNMKKFADEKANKNAAKEKAKTKVAASVNHKKNKNRDSRRRK